MDAGKVIRWHARDLRDGAQVECTERTWNILPRTERQAETMRSNYVRGDVMVYVTCGEDDVNKGNSHEQKS